MASSSSSLENLSLYNQIQSSLLAGEHISDLSFNGVLNECIRLFFHLRVFNNCKIFMLREKQNRYSYSTLCKKGIITDVQY